MYYRITKTKEKNKLQENVNLIDGYKFKTKLKITLYENSMIDYILTRKIKENYKKIIVLYQYLETESDEDTTFTLTAKIETLKSLLLGKYYPYIKKETRNLYLNKINEIENTLENKKNNKNRRR